jgi:uncharacterized FlaG/YvyC family protein
MATTILITYQELTKLLDSGVTFRVDEEGIVAEVIETETEEVVEEVEEEEMTEELRS